MVGALSWGYVCPSWGYVGPSWGYVGPSWGYVGPSWSYVGPSWGYVGPSWGYVGPSWGLCWPILRPILAHVDPSQTTRSEKWEKMGWAQNTVKRGSFWRAKVSPAGAAAPLSYGEERNAFGNATARGPLAGLWGLRLTAGRRPKQTRGRYALGVIQVHVLGHNRGRVVCRGCGCCVGGCCWCGVTDALGVVLTSPCVRRGPGLRASRQHPSSEGGWQPGCTWRTPKSGEPSCTLSLRKREKQASTLATFVNQFLHQGPAIACWVSTHRSGLAYSRFAADG